MIGYSCIPSVTNMCTTCNSCEHDINCTDNLGAGYYCAGITTDMVNYYQTCVPSTSCNSQKILINGTLSAI